MPQNSYNSNIKDHQAQIIVTNIVTVEKFEILPKYLKDYQNVTDTEVSKRCWEKWCRRTCSTRVATKLQLVKTRTLRSVVGQSAAHPAGTTAGLSAPLKFCQFLPHAPGGSLWAQVLSQGAQRKRSPSEIEPGKALREPRNTTPLLRICCPRGSSESARRTRTRKTPNTRQRNEGRRRPAGPEPHDARVARWESKRLTGIHGTEARAARRAS